MQKGMKLSIDLCSEFAFQNNDMVSNVGKDGIRMNLDKRKEFRILTEWIKQPVDHDKVNSEYFEQRIKILIPENIGTNTKVFFILGNESAISDEVLISSYRMYGKRNDMIFLLAEHRGYGKSVTSDEDQTVPKYVTIRQALADYHAIAEKYKSIYYGKWIAAGYSYGGGLSIHYGFLYPDDVDVILSSSGVVDWSFRLDSYEEQAKINLGELLYDNLVKHINRLSPQCHFDSNWRKRELIYSFVAGISQYEQNNIYFRKHMERLSCLPTDLFLFILRLLDTLFLKRGAMNYACSNAKLKLSREEAISGTYSWRVWHYQQFYETGVLWYSKEVNGLYRNSEEDWRKECELLFNEEPAIFKKEKWNVKDMVDGLNLPLVYVCGGKDPWKGVGLPENYKIKNGSYMYFKDAFHCPDRMEVNGVKVINEILKYCVSD